MLAGAPARALRVGGVNIAPGESRALSIALSRRGSPEKSAAVAIPAWAAVGPRPGPRVTVVAALHGFESAAARAAAELIRTVDPAALSGSLVGVPVLRAGRRVAPGPQPPPRRGFPRHSRGQPA